MRGSLRTVFTATAVAACCLPGTAHASSDATITAATSRLWAGYVQSTPQSTGLRYYQIDDTITVPKVTATTGAQISYDLAGIGGFGPGATPPVAGGIEVDQCCGGTPAYGVVGFWGTQRENLGGVSPGDVLRVSVVDDFSSGWLIEVDDTTTGQEWFDTKPDPSLLNTSAEAVEERLFLTSTGKYVPLTPTKPVTFDLGFAFWAQQGQTQITDTPLLSNVPSGATLSSVTMTNQKGKSIATPSKPDSDSDGFRVADGIKVPSPPSS